MSKFRLTLAPIIKTQSSYSIPSALVGVPLSLGDIFAEKGDGKVIMPYDGSIARFDGTTRIMDALISRYGGARMIALYNFSGYDSAKPKEAHPIRTVALCEQLRRFVMINRPEWHKHLRTDPRVWGTEAQIREAIMQAVQDGFDPEDPGVTLVTATNPMHHFRVARICAYLKPKAWGMKVGWVNHHFSWSSKIHEIGGTVRALKKMRKKGPIDFRALPADMPDV